MEPADRSRFSEWLAPLIFLSSNTISLIGVVLVTSATVAWLFLLPLLFQGEFANPYLGMLWVVVLGLFIVGLILIPVGIHLRRRRLQKQQHTDHLAAFPALTLQSPELRRLAGFIAVATFANVLIAGQLSYSTVEYMDSDRFCGQVCHTVMQPEYTAYQQSAHARVGCVGCHIGEGASWFVRSKLSGTRQVLAVLAHTYPRPIPSPVEQLRPARETCERCHWPERFTGDRFLVHTAYAEDEPNTTSTTVLLLKIGGRTWNGTAGIHGVHLNPKTRIEYVTTDPKRQVIPQVILTGEDGSQTVYNDTTAKVKPEDFAAGMRRTMDCVDCHNRPTHVFQLPERALDEEMAAGRISPKLPFIKKQALATLKGEYTDRDTASRQIASSLQSFYQGKYPQIYAQDRGLVDNAIAAVQTIYARNIFPEMRVTWGTHVNNLGHMDSPGCFRCHDGNHMSAAGRMISNECTTCHDLLAMEEKNPKILSDLGYSSGK